MTHSSEKYTPLSPCPYKLSGTYSCFRDVVATTSKGAVGKNDIFNFQVSCSQLHDATERESFGDHSSTKFWLQCDLRVPLGREVFWKHIPVMAVNMPGFLSFIQNQSEGLSSNSCLCLVSYSTMSLAVPILIYPLFSHAQQ